MSTRKLILSLCLAVCAHGAQPGTTKLTTGPSGPALEFFGVQGNILKIEAANQLENPAWDVLGAMKLTNNSARFTDVWCGPAPRRFYRLTESAPANPHRAPNFRLIDHQGRSHELHYFERAEDIDAFVLIFTQAGCAELDERWAEIRALHDRFATNRVRFYMVASHPDDARTNLVAEAERLAAPFPILHDRAQTVMRLYGIRNAAEAVVIQRAGMGIVYQGALDDRAVAGGAGAPRSYLEEAIAAARAGTTPQTLRARALGCDLPNEPAPDLSYSTVIAPLLQAKCVSCHSPGNVAPWSMTNHSIVRAYRSLMLQQIGAKKMPPWHADPEFGRFKNDISLSVEEERTLVEWLMAGAPRGEGPDPLANIPPPPPRWPAELGEPDLILRPPVQTIDATGVEPYRYIFVKSGLTEDKWLRAAVVKPTNTRVVHHYLVWEGENMEQMAAGLAGYVPGTHAGAFPTNSGILLRANSSVTFNLHYTPTGQPETDHPELALWFHKTPPAKELYTIPLLRQNFVIPAGARDHQVTQAIISMPVEATVHNFAPHMHLRGLRMRFDLVHPGGRRETLLNVPKYDFHWQTRYELIEPKVIPKGARVEIVGGFDNSDLNHFNPDPKSEVRWGEQSWEEMFIGYFGVTLNETP